MSDLVSVLEALKHGNVFLTPDFVTSPTPKENIPKNRTFAD